MSHLRSERSSVFDIGKRRPRGSGGRRTVARGRWLMVVAVLGVALVASACGDDDGGDGGNGDNGNESTPTATATATATATVENGGTDAATGEQVANQNGCLACHTTTGGSSAGPTWQGLFGSERPLEDGTTVTADEDYLRRSIVEPNEQVVEGFAPIMPTTFGSALDDDEIDALIEYIKTLE